MTNILIKAGIAASLACVSVSAYAAPTKIFAQYSQINNKSTVRYANQDVRNPGRPVTFTPGAEIFSVNNTRVMDTPIVNFTALVDGITGSGVSAGDVFQAYLSLDAFATSGVTFSGGSYRQLFDGNISFTDVSTGANLLTADFTAAMFNAANFAFTVDASSMTGTVDYTSDVFGFGTTNDFSISGTGTSTKIALAGTKPGRSLKSFNARTSGTFSTSVPEPAVLTLFGLGLAGVGLARRRAA